MANYYEDTMPLLTNKDEYLKYYLDESLPMFDKLNILMKKGQPFQRQALINNLNAYVNDSLFKSLIEYIISDIETWEIESCILLPKSLYNVLKSNKLENGLFNIIFKHMIVYMCSGAESLKNEYTYYFNELIDFYSINNNFDYEINNDIFELILSMGKFGQSKENRRLSCYFSSCFSRLLYKKNNNKEIIQKLYQRLSCLFYDNEKMIESQIIRELQYIIPIFKDIMFTNVEVNKAIECYILLDVDQEIQCLAIETLVKNLINIKEQKKILDILFGKIKEIIESKEYKNTYKNRIMDSLINSLYEENKILSKIIVKVLDMEVINYFLNIDSIESYVVIIKNFDKFYYLLNYSLKLIKNDSEIINQSTLKFINKGNCNNCFINNCSYYKTSQNFLFDDLFIKIHRKVYNKKEAGDDCSNNSSSSCNSFEGNENINNLKHELFVNLYKIIPCFSILAKPNKQLCETLIDIFKKENIINVLKYYNNNKNEKTKNKNELYKLLKLLMKNNYQFYNTVMKINTNNNNSNSKEIIFEKNFFNKLFNLILNNIYSSFQESQKNFDDNLLLLLSDIFTSLLPKIFKHYRNIIYYIPVRETNILSMKNNNIKSCYSEKIYEEMFKNILSCIISNTNVGDHIKKNYIELIPYLLLYSKKRNYYLEFIRNEIITSNNFFFRKYSIVFIKKCIDLFSFEFFDKLNLYDDLVQLLNDKLNLISTNILEIIYDFHKRIIVHSQEKFKEICTNLNKIYEINNKNFINDINNFDKEKNKLINHLFNVYNPNEEISIFYNEDELYYSKEIENKLITNETNINNYEINFEYQKNLNSSDNSTPTTPLNKNSIVGNVRNSADFTGSVNFYLNNAISSLTTKNIAFSNQIFDEQKQYSHLGGYKKGKTVKSYSNKNNILPKIHNINMRKESYNIPFNQNNLNVIKFKDSNFNSAITKKDKIKKLNIAQNRIPSAKTGKVYTSSNVITKIGKNIFEEMVNKSGSSKKVVNNIFENRYFNKGKSISNKQISQINMMALRPNSKNIILKNDNSGTKIYINAEKTPSLNNSINNK